MRKLLLGVNIALFKLLNGGACSKRGSATLQDAVVEVVDSLAQVLKARHERSNLPFTLKVRKQQQLEGMGWDGDVMHGMGRGGGEIVGKA